MRLHIETSKTKSGIRQVPLSRETIQAFQRGMKKRPKAEPFVIDGRSNFLFVNQKGKPKVAIDYNMLFVRMVKKYNKHHKDNPLPHITPHTLRHTFCTRLASKNMNPKDLQYIMGAFKHQYHNELVRSCVHRYHKIRGSASNRIEVFTTILTTIDRENIRR